jgi:hypothetical protein
MNGIYQELSDGQLGKEQKPILLEAPIKIKELEKQ